MDGKEKSWASLDVMVFANVGHMQKMSFEFVTYWECIWTYTSQTFIRFISFLRITPGWYIHFYKMKIMLLMINMNGRKYIWLREIIKYKDTHETLLDSKDCKFVYSIKQSALILGRSRNTILCLHSQAGIKGLVEMITQRFLKTLRTEKDWSNLCNLIILYVEFIPFLALSDDEYQKILNIH